MMMGLRGGVARGGHWLHKSYDAVLTAPLKAQDRTSRELLAAVRPGTSHTGRISALVNLLARLRPGACRRLSAMMIRAHLLPFRGYRPSLLACGSASTVFLLEGGRDRRVLKLFRRTLAKPLREVLEVVKTYQEKHARLESWFNRRHRIVVPSSFLVLHSPVMGTRSGAVLQPYVGGRHSDLFLDYSVDEAVCLLRRHPDLTSQWLDFSGMFLDSLATGWCFDLVGRENLMVLDDEGRLSLRIADIGMFDLAHLTSHAPAVYARLLDRVVEVQRLRGLVERHPAF